MKILHVCLASFFIDNYSYQENMLPKYHKLLGNDVYVIASLQTFDSNGNGTLLECESNYTNEYGIPVFRVDYKSSLKSINRILRRYNNIYPILDSITPDIIFIHGCQFFDINIITNYLKKHTYVKVYVDNHADFSNSATNWLSRNVLHRIIWRYCCKNIEPFTHKFYGVLPARVDFFLDIYHTPKQKTELLVMGADDEKVIEAKTSSNRDYIRQKYNVKSSDFLVMTGGKIDNFKKQTLLLMKAIKELSKFNIKLIVFGSVIQELKEEINNLCDGDRIQYVGWIHSQDAYKYFAASDLVVFPGRHSVFWEQVVGLGIPCVVKYWEGTTHIDLGGNCMFLYKDSVDEIRDVITRIYKDKALYNNMKKVAIEKGMQYFSYENISKKSIEE